MKKTLCDIVKVALSLILGGAILYWMYRDFDFHRMEHVMLHEMNWTWMLLSFPFGILAQAFRGWRWRQSLEPVGERPRKAVAVNAVFLSYAVSLVIPRIGEFARCGALRRWDGVSFAKALGTVVTERAIDTVLILMVTGITLLCQMSVFDTFFKKTGTRLDEALTSFSTAGWLVTAVCAVAVGVLLWYLLRSMAIYNKVKGIFVGLWQGALSVRHVKNMPLFIVLTLAIWLSYFLHYYLTFFCFDATTHLGMGCALVTFIVGSIAVVVPTPNGAGPWHFAVKTMLMLYGVAANEALFFVLIVHSVQTLLMVLLGIYAWTALALTRKRADTQQQASV